MTHGSSRSSGRVRPPSAVPIPRPATPPFIPVNAVSSRSSSDTEANVFSQNEEPAPVPTMRLEPSTGSSTSSFNLSPFTARQDSQDSDKTQVPAYRFGNLSVPEADVDAKSESDISSDFDLADGKYDHRKIYGSNSTEVEAVLVPTLFVNNGSPVPQASMPMKFGKSRDGGLTRFPDNLSRNPSTGKIDVSRIYSAVSVTAF